LAPVAGLITTLIPKGVFAARSTDDGYKTAQKILMRYAQRREKIKKWKEQEGKRAKGN